MSTLAVPPAEPVPAAPPVGAPGVVLRGVSWERYEAIWKAYEGRRGVRLNYDRGALEIMTISGAHGWLARLLGRLIVVLTEELNLPIRSGGDATRRRPDLARGVEPDESFWVTNEPRIRGRDEVDLTRDPPPDLCVEVEVSRPVLDRLGILAALGVPEVWHGDAAALEFLQLTGGRYVSIPRSPLFPFAAPADLLRFVERRRVVDENGVAREFRTWVRQQIAADGREP